MCSYHEQTISRLSIAFYMHSLPHRMENFFSTIFRLICQSLKMRLFLLNSLTFAVLFRFFFVLSLSLCCPLFLSFFISAPSMRRLSSTQTMNAVYTDSINKVVLLSRGCFWQIFKMYSSISATNFIVLNIIESTINFDGAGQHFCFVGA